MFSSEREREREREREDFLIVQRRREVMESLFEEVREKLLLVKESIGGSDRVRGCSTKLR
jgi:hypothetical protein